MALDRGQNFVSAQYLETKGQNLTKLCIHINVDKISFGNVNRYFSQFVTLVTLDRYLLDRCQNFVSAQYLENQWTEFDQIFYTH